MNPQQTYQQSNQTSYKTGGVDALDVNKLQILSCPVEVADKQQSPVQTHQQKSIGTTSPNFYQDNSWTVPPRVESLDARTPPNKEITSHLSDQLTSLSTDNSYCHNMNILNIENNANNVSTRDSLSFVFYPPVRSTKDSMF